MRGFKYWRDSQQFLASWLWKFINNKKIDLSINLGYEGPKQNNWAIDLNHSHQEDKFLGLKFRKLVKTIIIIGGGS